MDEDQFLNLEVVDLKQFFQQLLVQIVANMQIIGDNQSFSKVLFVN